MNRQFGTIPFVCDKRGIRIVLVTSANGYWIFPKGRYEKELGKHGTARLESYEEAGVKGRLYRKHKYRARVTVKSGKKARLVLYPLEVSRIYDEWPEDDRRKRRILPLADARKRIRSKALLACLQHFERDFLL